MPVTPRLAPRSRAETTVSDRAAAQLIDLGRLHGAEVGDLRLMVPRNADELAEWSRRLANCLGSYQEAVAVGQSFILGVEHDGRLTYCLEITPQRRIRQFVAARNRRPNRAHAAAVVDFLVRQDLVRLEDGEGLPFSH